MHWQYLLNSAKWLTRVSLFYGHAEAHFNTEETLMVSSRVASAFIHKNRAVRLTLFFFTSSGVPAATSWPPSRPASGPMSMR